MKITILSLVLALGALAATVPAVRIVPEPIARDTPTPDGTIDCSFCTGMLDFCFVNGHSPGQDGCKQSCREHVCHRTPLCKKCHGEFDQCPEQSRYHN